MQVAETRLLDNQDMLAQLGFSKTHATWFASMTNTGKATPNEYIFRHSTPAQGSRLWPTDGNSHLGLRLRSFIGEATQVAPVPITAAAAYAEFGDFKLRNTDDSISQEIISIVKCRKTHIQYNNCIWFRYNLNDGSIVGNDFWWVPYSYYFEFENDAAHKDGLQPLTWNSLSWKGNTDDQGNQTAQYYELDDYMKAHPTSLLSFQPSCFAYVETDLRQPLYEFNKTAPNIYSTHNCVLYTWTSRLLN